MSKPRRNLLDLLMAKPYLLVLGGTCLLGSVSLIYPFGRDQGIYAFLASSLFEGKTLYRDIWMGMAPLTVYIHALAFLLFGRSPISLRLLDLVWTMATAGLVFVFVRRSFGKVWLAVTAGLIYPSFYYLLGYWDTAQVDGFANFPVVAAFVLALTVLRSPTAYSRHWFWIGVLFGVAFFFKYPILILLAGLVIFAFFATRKIPALSLFDPGTLPLAPPSVRPKYNWRRCFASLIIGFLVPCVLTTVIISASGALPDFLQPILHRAFSYPAQSYLHEGLFKRAIRFVASCTLVPYFGIPLLFCSAGIVFSILVLLRRRKDFFELDRLPIILCWVWLGAGLMYVYIQGRFFPYHFLILLPVSATLGAIALYYFRIFLADSISTRRSRVLLAGVLSASLLAGSPYPDRFATLFRIVAGKLSLRTYWSQPTHNTVDFDLAAQLRVSNYIRTQSKKGERVLVWAADPLINFLADRPSATRFPYNHPLISLWSWPELKAEFVRSLKADPPAMLVVAHHDSTPHVTGHQLDSYLALKNFSEFADFVNENYEPIAVFGRYDVLRLAHTEDSLPSFYHLSTELLKQNLREALQFATQVNPSSYRYILWPWHAESAQAALPLHLQKRLVSYRKLNNLMWREETNWDSLLPSLSIWIVDDNRPLGYLSQLRNQNALEDLVTDSLAFTLLYSSSNRVAYVYLIERLSAETVR